VTHERAIQQLRIQAAPLFGRSLHLADEHRPARAGLLLRALAHAFSRLHRRQLANERHTAGAHLEASCQALPHTLVGDEAQDVVDALGDLQQALLGQDGLHGNE
jgi:hypothetical protein